MAARTDLWSINPPGGDDSATAWWATKDQALQAVRFVRRADGCNCDAPPWVSPPAEWPLRIRLDHHPECGQPLPVDDSPLGKLAAKNRQPVGHLSAAGITRSDDPGLIELARNLLGTPELGPVVDAPSVGPGEGGDGGT